MKNLLYRAKQVYQSEGLSFVVIKSVKFVPRYLKHQVGARGLYTSSKYRKLLRWWNSRPHSIGDPFKIIWIDPHHIIYVTGRGPNPGQFQWQDIGKIQGGEWDQCEERVEDLPVVFALRQRFNDNKDWEEIDFIRHILDQIEQGNIIWRGCSSEGDVWEACERVDELYESIRDQGYLCQRELVERNEISPDKYVTGDGFNRYDEVVVDIGRDGEFLFVDGRHRLAIARVLGIDRIPVRISARHTQWQSTRESIGNMPQSELPAEVRRYLDHPDVTQLSEQGPETD